MLFNNHYSNSPKSVVSVLIFFTLLFYVLNTTLDIASVSFSLAYLVLIFGVLFAFVKYPTSCFKCLTNFNFLLFVIFVFGLFLYASIIEILAGYSGGQFYFSKILINVIACSVFSITFSVLLIRNGFDIYHIFYFFFFVGVFNSIIIIFSFFIPEVRLFIESILYQQIGSNIDYMNIDWRLRGIAASGGASLSVFLAFSLLSGVICNKVRMLDSKYFLVYASAIIIAQFFVARTGLMFSFLIFFVWLIAESLKFRLRFYILLAVFASLLTVSFYNYYEALTAVLPFALEIFFNLFSGDGLETASTNELFEMLVLPNNPLHLSFGFGCFEGCKIYRSDSGYLKTISAIGLIFSLIIYSFVLYFLIFKMPKIIKIGSAYWIVFVFFLFLAEIKEPFIYQNYLSRAIILLVCFGYVSKIVLRDFNANLLYNIKP